MAETLSPRELKILELASEGLTDKAIASRLEISPTTVITYWARIRSKLGALSRPELVGKLVQQRAQIEVDRLRAELEQHIALENELRQDVNRLRNFIDFAPEAMIIVNQDGVILSGNERASVLLECPKSAFPGLQVSQFIPAELHELHHVYREQYFKNPSLLSMGHDESGVDVCTLKGQHKKCVLTLNLATFEGEQVVVIIRSIERTQSSDETDEGLSLKASS